MNRCILISYPALNKLLKLDEVTGKFVQFRWRGVEYLIFAPRSQHRFHNQILAQFLEEEGLPHRWAGTDTLKIGVDGLTVIGGGRFRLQPLHHLVELWDSSTAYGRFDETGIEAKIRTASPAMKGFSVRVDD